MGEPMEALDCKGCGSEIFVRDEPWWQEDEEETCAECGMMHRVHVDDETAYAWTDEHITDIGQPRCQNECGDIYTASPSVVAEFMDAPCKWTCAKAKAWKASL